MAVVAAFSAFPVPSTDRFSVGAWAGGSATAAGFAGMYAYDWWNDRRHVTESRQYWVRRQEQPEAACRTVTGEARSPY